MTLSEAKELINFCEGRGIKQVAFGQFVVEFFSKDPQSMNLDPQELAKTLSDSMPPDSAMLFASSEDMSDKLTPETRENADMN